MAASSPIPIVTTTASGNTTVKGQVKPGSFGKFVYPLATIAAGRQYTFRYTPQFSQLAQQGKLAMVGFGLKNGNDFHIVGLRGDGSTGLHKYKVNGTPPNGWNKDTGHTTSDGGARPMAARPGRTISACRVGRWRHLQVPDQPDGSTWTDEYTGQTPTPFSNVSGVATFGIALWFNNADAGPFSIVIDQFADVGCPTGSTGSAWTTSNTASSPALDTWGHIAIDKDATGKCRMYVNGVMLGSVTPADSSMFDSTAALEIGRLFGATANLSGWMDELRITKGVARYASDAGFTVPSAAFPRS
jgi:hypothetical protein